MKSEDMAEDFPSANATESYCMMLEERVSKLEDIVVQLQPRFSPASTFVTVDFLKVWYVRMYLRLDSWPSDGKRQRTLADQFFRDLRSICKVGNDESATLVLCGHVEAPLSSFSPPIRHTYQVVEGILLSDVHSITSEAIGAAFERSWSNNMIHLDEPYNVVKELPTDQGSAVVDAVHVINGSTAAQFELNRRRDELWTSTDIPDNADVACELFKVGVDKMLFDNPRFHEVFPQYFWRKPTD